MTSTFYFGLVNSCLGCEILLIYSRCFNACNLGFKLRKIDLNNDQFIIHITKIVIKLLVKMLRIIEPKGPHKLFQTVRPNECF